MKCDLCKHQNPGNNLLCGDCADMIRRLLALRERAMAGEVGDAAPLSGLSGGKHSTASIVG